MIGLNTILLFNRRLQNRSLYSYAPITDSDYSLVPFAYVVTITSILWGAESVNKVKIIESSNDRFVTEIFIKCRESNSKESCLLLKKYLENTFYKNNYNGENFTINFK